MTAIISLGVMNLLDGLSDPVLTLAPGMCLEKCPFHPDFFIPSVDWILSSDNFCPQMENKKETRDRASSSIAPKCCAKMPLKCKCGLWLCCGH